MNNFIEWQINNKNHIITIFNIIYNDLNNNEIIIKNKKKFYNDIVIYLYNTTQIYKNKYLN
tara:strand:- start:421 stop:603 length:183 start_codon:yes stop_codon:yes gene_type:complete